MLQHFLRVLVQTLNGEVFAMSTFMLLQGSSSWFPIERSSKWAPSVNPKEAIGFQLCGNFVVQSWARKKA